MCTWQLRMKMWNIQNTQKTTAKQAIRMRSKTSTHGMRCWRHSRCRVPAQRCNRACRIWRYAGGIVVPLRVGHPVHVHGSAKQGSDCRDAQKTRCASLWLPSSRCGKQERLLHAQTHWDSEAERTWTLSGLDWAKVDPGRGHSFARSLHEK